MNVPGVLYYSFLCSACPHIQTIHTWKQGMIININDLRQATLTEALATSDRENDEDILTLILFVISILV